MTELMQSSYSAVLNVNGFGEFPWLKDPLDPSRNMEFEITSDNEFSWLIDKGQGSFDVVGRRVAITVTDVTKGAQFEGFTAALVTKEEEDKFNVLFNSNRAILLQLPDARQWFIIFKKCKFRLPPGTGPFMYVDVQAIETDEPDVA